MPCRAKKRGDGEPVASPPVLEPALGHSAIVNQEGLDKVRRALADATNEWGPTRVWLASRPVTELAANDIHLHLHAIFGGLLPPFSAFFYECSRITGFGRYT